MENSIEGLEDKLRRFPRKKKSQEENTKNGEKR